MKAIISVSDKTGLDTLALCLIHNGFLLIGTGGTVEYLASKNISCQKISEYTQSPEVLGGRVKALHPAIFSGILARKLPEDIADLDENGWNMVDLVVVNLYPFDKVISREKFKEEDAIENIDIGGVALIRAGAKNFTRVCVVSSPDDYPELIQRINTNSVDIAYRKQLAAKAFGLIANYDSLIQAYLLGNQKTRTIKGVLAESLRYGENPHQKAEYYCYPSSSEGPLGGKMIQGKQLSYNNLLDLDAAWRSVIGFALPTVSIVKHLSPCGIASAGNDIEAYSAALACDPVSAFGSVIAVNCEVSETLANEMNTLFIECIAAAGFSEGALCIFAKKKNLRLLDMSSQLSIINDDEIKTIRHGFLVQTPDTGDPEDASPWKVVTKCTPTDSQLLSLAFAWKAVQALKSNAIVLCCGSATVGIGSGQPNRIDSLEIAAKRAGARAAGAVLASDGFFPFADSIEAAYKYGITAIIQPGGSVRDNEVIEDADRHNIPMVFTGVRHFRH